MAKKDKNGQSAGAETNASGTARLGAAESATPDAEDAGSRKAARRATVAKVSHTLSIALAERLEEFAFFQRVSESAVIEHSLAMFFAQSNDDATLGDQLRLGGAGRRRKSV